MLYTYWQKMRTMCGSAYLFKSIMNFFVFILSGLLKKWESAKKYLLNGLARDRLPKEKKVHTRLMGVTSFQISTAPKFTEDDAFRIWKLLVTIDKSTPWCASFQWIVARRVFLQSLVFVFCEPWTTFLALPKKTKSSLRLHFLWPISKEIHEKREGVRADKHCPVIFEQLIGSCLMWNKRFD